MVTATRLEVAVLLCLLPLAGGLDASDQDAPASFACDFVDHRGEPLPCERVTEDAALQWSPPSAVDYRCVASWDQAVDMDFMVRAQPLLNSDETVRYIIGFPTGGPVGWKALLGVGTPDEIRAIEWPMTPKPHWVVLNLTGDWVDVKFWVVKEEWVNATLDLRQINTTYSVIAQGSPRGWQAYDWARWNIVESDGAYAMASHVIPREQGKVFLPFHSVSLPTDHGMQEIEVFRWWDAMYGRLSHTTRSEGCTMDDFLPASHAHAAPTTIRPAP